MVENRSAHTAATEQQLHTAEHQYSLYCLTHFKAVDAHTAFRKNSSLSLF